MLIENTADTLEYIQDLSDIEVLKTIDTAHTTNIFINAVKDSKAQQLELIIYSNYKNVTSNAVIAGTNKNQILIQDKELKIIDKRSKTITIEYYLPILPNYILHLHQIYSS